MPFNDPDKVDDTRTIYQVGAGEIFWRNFLAGMARALGGLLIYFAVVIVLVNVFMNYLWPVLEPSFQQFSAAVEGLEQLNQAPRFFSQ